MHTRGELYKLITQAQQGCEASRDRLSQLVRVPLEEYVYRLTLDHDMTQDIVQETILTMFKVLGQLRKTDRFWPWLYRIAFRKMLDVQKEQKHDKEILTQIPQPAQFEDPEGLANLVSQELQQIVMQAMRQIKPRHRQVLTLRCYAELEYKEIAEAMSCSEFGVRMLFWRAKNSLAKQLSRLGFKKGGLLTALVVFGKMTSRSEASVTQTTVTGGSLQVGVTAAAAGALGTKTGIVTVLTAGILAVGAGLALSGKLKSFFPSTESPQFSGHAISWQNTSPDRDGLKELWYYYPDGNEGPLMLRAVASNDDSGYSYCQWLQNARYNYFYDRRQNTGTTASHRCAGICRVPLPG